SSGRGCASWPSVLLTLYSEDRRLGGPRPTQPRRLRPRLRAAGGREGGGRRPWRRPGLRGTARPGPHIWGAASAGPLLGLLVDLAELLGQRLALFVRQLADHAVTALDSGGHLLGSQFHRPHSTQASSAIAGRCRVRTGWR